jgi:hypothetical protein
MGIWGRVLEKLHEARAVAYADKLSIALQVLAELKRVTQRICRAGA